MARSSSPLDRLRMPAARELIVVLLLFTAAAWWGAKYVADFRAAGLRQTFYQEYFEPAAMIACGHGFVRATPYYGAAMNEFLHLRQDAFDCAALPPQQTVSGQALAQHAWFYLIWMVGLYWSIAGVSWSALVPLFGLLFGLVIVLAYAFCRLAMPMAVALLPAIGLMASTMHRQNLPHLRDYAKAPFVITLLLILVVMVKYPPTPRRLLAWCAGYGLVLGVGYGFRTDFLANIPALIITVICFVPGFHWRALATKAASLVVAFAIFTAVAWPVISYVTRQGGCQWHVVLLGLEFNYNDNLSIAPSYYQWITRYSDEYVHTSVNSYLHRMEGVRAVPFCDPSYDQATGAYLADIATHFPADFLTRAYTASLRVMDLPFYLWATPRDVPIPRSGIGQMLTPVVGTARLASIVAIVLLGAINWRWGLFAVFVAGYFGSYPMLQFAPRHFFHLELLGWWAMGFVLWQGLRALRQMARPGEGLWPAGPAPFLRRGAVFALLVISAVLAPLPIVRAAHDGSVQELTDTLLSAPRVEVPMVMAEGGGGLRLAAGTALAAPGDPTQTAYLDVEIDLAACPKGVSLGLQYDPADVFNNFTAVIQPQPREAVVERYLTPVFRGFQGVTVADGVPACVRRVTRLASVRGLPLLPTLTLPANWRELPRHQRIGAQALRLWDFGH